MKTYRIYIEDEFTGETPAEVAEDFAYLLGDIATQLNTGYSAGQYWELKAIHSSSPDPKPLTATDLINMRLGLTPDALPE